MKNKRRKRQAKRIKGYCINRYNTLSCEGYKIKEKCFSDIQSEPIGTGIRKLESVIKDINIFYSNRKA